MRKLWWILVVFVLAPTTVLAKPASLPAIVKLTPMTQEKNYYEPRITVKFDRKVSQDFHLKLSPNVTQFNLLKKGHECIWELKPYATFRPKTKYTAVLTSTQYFIFHGKKTKSVKWTFTTSDKQSMAEQWENYGLEQTFEKYPLTIYLPHEESNYIIDWPDEKGVYKITLTAIFNAGVNGPPIKIQLKNYYADIELAKKAALKWIRSKGQDPKKMKINWDYPKY